MNSNSSVNDLEHNFKKHGIDYSSIGFYDSKSFLKVEQKNPDFLANYAHYLRKKPFTDEYLKKAKFEIPFISKLLFTELVKDGRMGACIDMSCVLSRILEAEKLWNYTAKGSLTIEFDKKLEIETKYFWSVDIVDNAQIRAAHVWVVAPPYNVVDLTVNRQPYKHGEEKYIPEFICETSGSSCNIDEIDLISPIYSGLLSLEGVKENKLHHVKKGYEDFVKTFPPCLIEAPNVKLKYVTIAISAPDMPLKKISSLKLSGKLGFEIYEDVIKPQLNEFRKSIN